MSITEWLDLMPDTVTVEPFLSRDGYGVPTYGDPVSYPARVMGGNRQITRANGQEAVSTARVIIGAAIVLSVDDRITLPADFSPNSPPILQIRPVRDGSGPHHVELDV